MNESTDDKAGWDFEVEEASPLEIDFGAHSKPVFRVQVKSTVGASSDVSMTFSSLLSLIRFGGPAFVLLYRFGDSLAPIDAFLLHLDRAKGTEILTELRKRQVANPAVRVNRAKMTIRFEATQRLKSADGNCLTAGLRSALSGSFLSYLETKAKWLKELEVDSWRRHVKIEFKDAASIRAMADALLGLGGEFQVKSASFFAAMGIPDRAPEFTSDFHSTTARPHPENAMRAVVRLRTSEYGRTYEFKGTLYTTPKHFPKPFAAMRVQCALFDVVIRLGEDKIEFRPANLTDDALRAPIGEFRGFGGYVREAFSSSETLLELEMEDGLQPLKFPLRHRTPNVPPDFEVVQAVLEVLHARLAALGLTNSLFRPASLIQSLEQYSFFLHLDQTFNEVLELEFDFGDSANERADVVIFNMPVVLEGRTVIFFAALFGPIERISESQVRGRFERSEFLGEIVIPDGLDRAAAIGPEAKRLKAALQERGLSVL